jgi:hypothetical protein
VPGTTGPAINPYPGCQVSVSSTLCFGPLQLWKHSAFTEGGFYVAGTDLTGNAHLYAFDVVKWQWLPYQQLLPLFNSADLFSWGGFILAVGGSTDDMGTELAYIQTSVGAGAAWSTASVTGVPSAHDGHRLITFGGILYMMGGITNDPVKGWMTSNAMWSLDLNAYFNSPGNTSSVSWNKIQPANSPGVWSPRGAFSLNVYSATILLFGGLKRQENVAPPPGTQNICTVPGSNCQVFNDIWMFQPGIATAPQDINTCGASNCGWSLVQVTGAAVPPPRFDHASGVLADNLYIFGGATADGTFLTDLWLFNIEDSVWRAVTSSFQGTDGFVNGAFPPQLWAPSMSVVGHNLYVEMTGDGRGAGVPGNAIYRWVPEAPAPSGASGSGNDNASSIATGHTAGIVLGLLLGLANLYLLVRIAKNNSIDIIANPLASGGRIQTNDGFYSSHAGSAPNDAAYAPPA